MQPLSGNQLLELRTSLLKMPLVLRLPRKMHLCRSSSNLPRLPSFLKMLQNPHVLVTFQWMHNPLHLPHKTMSERPKCLRDPQFLTLLTSKCASRHNAVHFFNISTSKTAPNPSVFNTFYFQMCFAPQRRALFRHLNFQKCSETDSLTFLLPYVSIYASFHPSSSLSTCPSIYLLTCRSICLTATSTTKQCCYRLLLAASKTKQFCETFSLFAVENIKNEAILRDFLQKWKVDCTADGLVPMRFAIFPCRVSKVLRLPRKS